MKKILLLGAVLCCGSLVSHAQSIGLHLNQLSMNTFSATPTIPDVTAKADMKANIFSADLVGSFGVFQNKPGNLLRVGLGYQSIKLDAKSNSQFDDETDNFTGSLTQTNFRIVPGISTNIAGTDRYSFYAGADLPFGIIGSTKATGETKVTAPNDTSGIMETHTFRTDANMDGGLSIGLSPFVGFSYNFSGPFSLGTEIASGLQYTSIGSSAEAKFYEDNVLQDSGTTDLKISSFSKMPVRLSIVLAYRFGGGSTRE